MKSSEHSHSFGQHIKRKGENKTLIVIIITLSMMLVEISSGFLFGSMALLADGIHMASHSVALIINVMAYIYARRKANDSSFNFGTGKINALGGFTGAILLTGFSLMMVWESISHWINPTSINFNQAIFVAVVGLLVNGFCAVILNEESHSHSHGSHSHEHHNHSHSHDSHSGEDHNLKSAYLHVLADALTSVLAIVALVCAKFIGTVWMDPLMGILGGILVARWSLSLIKSTSSVLLDKKLPDNMEQKALDSLRKNGNMQVRDIHLWSIGPGINSLILAVSDPNPKQPQYYKDLLPKELNVAHATVEVTPLDG